MLATAPSVCGFRAVPKFHEQSCSVSWLAAEYNTFDPCGCQTKDSLQAACEHADTIPVGIDSYVYAFLIPRLDPVYHEESTSDMLTVSAHRDGEAWGDKHKHGPILRPTPIYGLEKIWREHPRRQHCIISHSDILALENVHVFHARVHQGSTISRP